MRPRNAGSGDTLVAFQVPMDGSAWREWARAFAANGAMLTAPGGGLLLRVFTARQSATRECHGDAWMSKVVPP